MNGIVQLPDYIWNIIVKQRANDYIWNWNSLSWNQYLSKWFFRLMGISSLPRALIGIGDGEIARLISREGRKDSTISTLMLCAALPRRILTY